MLTIYTLMPIFNKPGSLRDLLTARGITVEWIAAQKPSEGMTETEAAVNALKERAPEMEYLLVDTTPLDREFFAAAKKLKLAAMFGVGLDHIDIPAATEHGVVVTNAPGANARCVAEATLSFMLDLAHNTTRMHMDMVAGEWRPRLGSELNGKTLGVVGLGHIGQDVARLGKALGMRVIAANRTPRPEIVAELGIAQVSLDEVLTQADYVSLHIPGGPDSWRFGAEDIAKMKKTAFFINMGRGELVDLEALTEALREGRLAGAGLDVFPEEPMDPAHPIFTLPRVVTTPHTGSMSREAMERVAALCLDEFMRAARGERSANARNSEVYAMPCWREKGR